MKKEYIEECKKWVYLDRNTFVNYKSQLQEIDNIQNTEELHLWINQYKKSMKGLPSAALECIRTHILIGQFMTLSKD